MVGLVIVSHSHTLAEALRTLAGGVVDGSVPIACAAGTGDDHQELGTDVTEIVAAIRSVDSPEGVLVLADLGSAVLGAETAIELLGDSLVGPVRLAAAPLVEGAVSAAVQISLGADLDTVAREAGGALFSKQEHLEGEGRERDQSAGCGESGTGEWHQGRFRVTTRQGLHARPLVHLVKTAARHDVRGEIRPVRGDQPWVNVRSFNRVVTLQIRSGEEFEIRFTGAEAPEALEAVADLAARQFGEQPQRSETMDSDATRQSRSGSTSRIRGMPASAGLALAPVEVLRVPRPSFGRSDATEGIAFREAPLGSRQVWRDLAILRDSIRLLTGEIRLEAGRASREGRQEIGEIGEAHAMILEDPELLRAAGAIYSTCEMEPLEAFWRAAESVSREYQRLEDAYMRVRAIDVLDVAVRLVSFVDPRCIPDYTLPESPVILAADELLPSYTMHLDGARVQGIMTTGGSPSSHAAIIVRGLGIPMVTAVDLPPEWQNFMNGREVILDGYTGEIDLTPDEMSRRTVLARREEEERRRAERRTLAFGPASLLEGPTVRVEANIATAADAREAAVNGADGVGVLRTEFLFLGRREIPGEEAQLLALREMTAPFGSMPVTVRLLDIGGDKDVVALNLPREANPFLGVRGVRLLLHRGFEDLLRGHLRAVLRLACERDVRIMIPMVTMEEEIREVRVRLQAARDELVREEVPHRWPLDLGIMVETPAAALVAERLARAVDFFSIGTNDLTQFVMAAERGNEALAVFDNALHPAVLTAVRSAIRGAASAGIPLSVCGEIGSDPGALPVLIGLGVRSLSVSPVSVIAVKEQIRVLRESDCREYARDALSGETS
ncbi:MAG: phosphoenolpyruvate--protein phosphotransferase [Spirochaetaceae bacterium]|nr:MAG: phosphoenolpyruvate--protein phosphotransferase [Spirochaetaceae bacterium]